MAHYPEMDDEEEEWEDTPAPRRKGPRFGPFVTIAAAILVLFGAASRLGKPMDGNGLLDIVELSAKNRLDEERQRINEQREQTVISLGGVPVVTPESLRPNQPDVYGRPTASVQPPYRDASSLRPPSAYGDSRSPMVSSPYYMPDAPENYDRSGPFDPAPEALPGTSRSGSTYTVAAGDNWVKIAKATGKRWQDIQKANPASKNGLRVGMKLVLP